MSHEAECSTALLRLSPHAGRGSTLRLCVRRLNSQRSGVSDQIGCDGRRRHRAGDQRGDGRGAARGRPQVWSGLAVLHRLDRACGAAPSRAPPFRRPPSRRRRRPTASSWVRCPTTTIRRSPRAGSIRPASCASGSICSPISARRCTRGGFPPRCGSPVDLVIVRENTEGFYADRSMFLGPGEFMPTPDLALAVRKITRAGSHPDRRGGVRARHAAAQES